MTFAMVLAVPAQTFFSCSLPQARVANRNAFAFAMITPRRAEGFESCRSIFKRMAAVKFISRRLL
jgi:hypothetical protein